MLSECDQYISDQLLGLEVRHSTVLKLFNCCQLLLLKTRVVGAAAYLLLALMDHFEIDVGPPSSDLERPFEP